MPHAPQVIPIKPEHLRLQGFKWLGKYFYEAYLVFGAASAVLTYDNFHQGILDITGALANPEPNSLFHVLDDAIFISSTVEANKALTDTYKTIASKLNLTLAPEDKGDKAFSLQTKGKILGVVFDTCLQTWSFTDEKILKYSLQLQHAVQTHKVSKETFQSILGMLNTVINLSPNLRFFRNPLLHDLKRAYAFHPAPVAITAATRYCLYNWLRVLQQVKLGFPLCRTPPIKPPVGILSFTTDAAGLKLGKHMDFAIGAGAVQSIYPSQEPGLCLRALWPKSFITSAFDSKQAYIGAKSTCLEMLGTILPLYHCANDIIGAKVLIEIDNKAVVQAFDRGRCPGDAWASLLLEALMFVANDLPCQLFFQHRRRCSTTIATMADKLSRSDAKGLALTRRLHISEDSGWPPSLHSWMLGPWMDPYLAQGLLKDFRSKLGRGKHSYTNLCFTKPFVGFK